MAVVMKCDINQYRNAVFPQFADPIEIGNFSRATKKDVSFDKKQLQRLNLTFPPPSKTKQQIAVNFDLNEGYEEHINKPTETPKLDRLLEFASYRQKMSQNVKSTLKNADFVSYRGLLVKIASTLYSPKDAWIVCVTKFQDVYFLCEFRTAEKLQAIADMSPREKLMTYWGHRFERFLLSPQPSQVGSAAGKSGAAPVNLNEECFSIVRTKLDKHRLVFGGEVDGIDPTTNEYLELKTNRFIETPKHMETFLKFKIVKWWLQSFLIGINTIICGYRDDGGKVRVLEKMGVNDLLTRGEKYWSGAVCLSFLSEFLSVVKTSVRNNDADAVFKFEYDPEKRRILFCRDTDAEHVFLADWFVGQFSAK